LPTEGGTLFKSELPKELLVLEFYEIEDVLCIYKSYFAGDVADVDDALACWTEDEDDEDDE